MYPKSHLFIFTWYFCYDFVRNVRIIGSVMAMGTLYKQLNFIGESGINEADAMEKSRVQIDLKDHIFAK